MMTTRFGRTISGDGDAAVDPSRERVEALDYIRSMLAELNEIARREKFDMVAYLLEMACVEAADVLAREATAKRRKVSRA